MVENFPDFESDIADAPRHTSILLGYLRCGATLLSWNAIPLVCTAALAVLISTDQGQELLKIDGQSAPSVFEQTRKTILPLLVWVIGLTLTSLTATQAGAPRLMRIADQHGLPSNVLVPSAGLFVAIAVGYAPIALIGIATHASAYVVGATVLLSIPVLVPWWADARALSGLPSSATRTPATAQALILSLTLSEAVLIAGDPIQARAAGAIGVAVVGFAFWSTILTLVLVVMPLRFGFPSAAVLAPVPWLVVSILHDSNEFPRHPDPVVVRAQPSIAEVHEQFIRWIVAAKVPETGSIPVYLVSAEGGGLRAAYLSCFGCPAIRH